MGVYLAQPKTEKITYEGNGVNFRFAASEMQGWRKTMEDSSIADLTVKDDISVFGVFDGHGGQEVAKFVKVHFLEELKKNTNFQNEKFDIALKETFYKMDELLETENGKKELNTYKLGFEEGGMMDSESYAGCTANVALIHKNKLYCANAGDSRCVLIRDGNIFPMSEDHKPDNELEKQRITKAGGIVANGRINMNLNLSRALGDLEYKKNTSLKLNEQLIIAEPDIQIKELSEKDEFILMGCDGIWETLSIDEIIAFIKKRFEENLPLKEIIERFLDKAIAPNTSIGLGCDNMTTILIVPNKK